MKTLEYFVALDGDDRWSGHRPSPDRAHTDGPFQTLHRAQKAIRGLKQAERRRSIAINIRNGIHFLPRPLILNPKDSGIPETRDITSRVSSPELPIVFRAYRGESPVISGGRRITGWRESTLRGRKVWVATLPDVKNDKWNFTQLWINGTRRQRPRLPKSGVFLTQPPKEIKYAKSVLEPFLIGSDFFHAKPGDIRAWHNLNDVEFVGLHYWVETRRRIADFNPRTGRVKLEYPSRLRLTNYTYDLGVPYYLDNVFEALEAPGQWYLDRRAGELYYLPLPGETIEKLEAIAPRLDTLVRLEGGRRDNQFVESVRFKGITFSHTEWDAGNAKGSTSPPQASCDVPGAIVLSHARTCAFDNCTFAHLGTYGIELLNGSRLITIAGNTLTDLGAGGIKIWHGCMHNLVCDNRLRDGGHLFHSACGILIGHSHGNRILHNEVHDFFYTGISAGWTWGYAESQAFGNIVEYNHIYNIGRGMLNDMGGIYTLGVSPGTRIRYNIVHDVQSRYFGGFGIYLDEGSSHILVEKNLVYRTKSAGFMHHIGRENRVTNNIIALCGAGIQRVRQEEHESFEFSRNIVLVAGQPVLHAESGHRGMTFANNLYWNTKRGGLMFSGKPFRDWRRMGADSGNLLADPQFTDIQRDQFTLKSTSPGQQIGFSPWDFSKVGPRSRKES